MEIRIGSQQDFKKDENDNYIYAPFESETVGSEYNESIESDDSMTDSEEENRFKEAFGINTDSEIPANQDMIDDDVPYDEEIIEESVSFEDVEAVEEDDQIIDDESDMVSRDDYDALMDRYQRLISDWDNYRRRSADDIAQAKANANRNIVEAMIPTFDHFGFALSHSQSMEDNPAAQEVAKGFEAIYRAMIDSLSREGLSVIDPAPGSPFDMNENQAIEQVPGTGMEPESIVNVIQVGYKFNDYVIRPAMVAVAS